MTGSPENYDETIQTMKERLGNMGVSGSKMTTSGIPSDLMEKLKNPKVLLVLIPVIVLIVLYVLKPSVILETPLTPDQPSDLVSKSKLAGWTIGISFCLFFAYYIYSTKTKENRDV